MLPRNRLCKQSEDVQDYARYKNVSLTSDGRGVQIFARAIALEERTGCAIPHASVRDPQGRRQFHCIEAHHAPAKQTARVSHGRGMRWAGDAD